MSTMDEAPGMTVCSFFTMVFCSSASIAGLVPEGFWSSSPAASERDGQLSCSHDGVRQGLIEFGGGAHHIFGPLRDQAVEVALVGASSCLLQGEFPSLAPSRLVILNGDCGDAFSHQC